MHLARRGVSVVFNGEIYNFAALRKDLEKLGHRFRSHCDTEVLLAAYSEWEYEAFSRLNGMFAIALYDAPKQRLLLVRDRAGEKPLYYRRQGDALYFASELKALLAHPGMPRRIDPEALDCYLMLGYVPGAHCILDGYCKLPPAHLLNFDLHERSVSVRRYWTVPEFDARASAGEDDLVNEFEALLEDAVGLQLRADVPVGVLLSGGVDSSLVTAMAVRQSPHVRTFSIGFPGHRADETAHARLVARHFGTQHTELVAEPSSAELIPQLAVQFDEPLADSSMIPTFLVSRLVREQCTVALGGDGADELFGGYSHYSRMLRMDRHRHHIPATARRATAWGAEHLLPSGFFGRNYLRAIGSDLTSAPPLVSVYFDATTRRRLMRGHAPWPVPADRILRTYTPTESDLLQRATRMDFLNYLPDDILVKVDRTSMLNSLEIRAPMLDFRLIDFAFGRVPSHLKATTSEKKILMKRLTERLLPASFDRQRKQGFSIPIAEWLRNGPFRELFHDVLSNSDSIFDRNSTKALLRGQSRGLKNGDRLYALVQFELWRQAYHAYL